MKISVYIYAYIYSCVYVIYTYVAIYMWRKVYVCVQCYFTFRAAGKSFQLVPKFSSVCFKELCFS